MKIDARGKVVETANKTIPHNEKGDPAFTTLEALQKEFTDEEIVQLVNRQLYAIEYQRTIHRQRARVDLEKMKELKARLLQMFGVKWSECSEDQIQQAAAAIANERLKGEQK